MSLSSKYLAAFERMYAGTLYFVCSLNMSLDNSGEIPSTVLSFLNRGGNEFLAFVPDPLCLLVGMKEP